MSNKKKNIENSTKVEKKINNSKSTKSGRNEGIFNLQFLGRLVLCASFLPYIVGVIIGMVYAFVGYDIMTVTGVYVRTIYGFDALREVITLYGLGLTFIPIIPVCFIYQLVYFLWWLIKYLKNTKR